MGGWGGCRALGRAGSLQSSGFCTSTTMEGSFPKSSVQALREPVHLLAHSPHPAHQDHPNSLSSTGTKHPILLLLHPPVGARPFKSTTKPGMVWAKRLRTL